MPQVAVPSDSFLRKGHLKSISQQAPQRLHSPRLSASAAITSCLRRFVRRKRRNLPCACRARKRASSTARRRFAAASRSSSVRRLLGNGRMLLRGFIRGAKSAGSQPPTPRGAPVHNLSSKNNDERRDGVEFNLQVDRKSTRLN